MTRDQVLSEFIRSKEDDDGVTVWWLDTDAVAETIIALRAELADRDKANAELTAGERRHRRYLRSGAFKQECLRCIRDGEPLMRVAERLAVPPRMLAKWCRQAGITPVPERRTDGLRRLPALLRGFVNAAVAVVR